MISDHTSDFELTPGQIWLNAASEGPIPTVSAKALLGAIQWKLSPERLTISKFIEVPVLLKRVIGRLINVDPEKLWTIGKHTTLVWTVIAFSISATFKIGPAV